MKRAIEQCIDIAKSFTPPATGLHAWLSEQAETYKLEILLAHALDGIIWGRWDGQRLLTAYKAAGPANHEMARHVSAELRDETLQEARLFSADRELHIWRSGNGWQGHLIRQIDKGETPTFTECIDETHILWGDQADPVGTTGFTLMSDGAQGLRHAIPLESRTVPVDPQGGHRPLQLKVRHYLSNDVSARIVKSRLVGLERISR